MDRVNISFLGAIFSGTANEYIEALVRGDIVRADGLENNLIRSGEAFLSAALDKDLADNPVLDELIISRIVRKVYK